LEWDAKPAIFDGYRRVRLHTLRRIPSNHTPLDSMKEALADPKTTSKKAWEEAYETILDQILTLQIKPGEAVTEIALSDRLGIGRTPVREALKRLEQEGLIVTHNQRKRVYILSIREIEEIFDLKTAIEGSIARWATERGTDAQFADLQRIQDALDGFRAARETDDKAEEAWLTDWLDLDRGLHAHLFQMAENHRAEGVIKNLNVQWHRLKVGILAMEGRIDRTVAEHQKFVEAILARDPAAAEQAMAEHLQNLKRELVKLLKVYHYPV
jgi:DNA-binding GntR family transcriptional regulator